ARVLYEDVYCRRGQAENHIKSWKTHLAADRTSCTKATANQFRLFLHAGAYWLMWGLRASMPRRSMWRVAQFDTLRLRLVKIAARVVEMKTMIRVHLPTSCPGQEILRSPSSASRASSPETRGVSGPERQTHPFNPQTSSTRLRPKAGDDAARPRASAVPKNHQNAPPTDAETSRRCIMQANSSMDIPNRQRPTKSDRSHGEVDSDQRSGRVRLRTPTLETSMPTIADRHDAPTAIQTNLAAIFISLELSRSIWLITSLSPGFAGKMSKHSVQAGDVAALLARVSELKRKASERTGKSFPIVVIQEAGLDGFWLHRVLQSEGIESHVVDPASIATSRRRRRAKTDRIDGEALLRALLAFKRGEPRVCAMVKAPTPEEEDRRRLSR